MQILSPGVFQVADKEVITIDVQSTGATTLFGVNYSLNGSGAPLTAGQPLKLTMDKTKANGTSFVPNAKSAELTLLFSFSSTSGGRYDVKISGSGGGPAFNTHANQAGNTPEAIGCIFHIV